MRCGGVHYPQWGLLLLAACCSAANIGFITSNSDSSASHLDLFRSTVLNSSTSSSSVPLYPLTRVIDTSDPFAATQAVCSLLDEGVTGIIIDTAKDTSNMAALCQMHDVPCFGAHIAKRGEDSTSLSAVFNLMPDKETIAGATDGMLHVLHWRSVTVVYDSLDHLALVEKVLTDDYFTVKLIKVGDKEDIKKVLEVVANTPNPRVVLSLNPHHMHIFLHHHEHQRNITTSPKYLVPTLDIQETRLKQLVRSGASAVYALYLGDVRDETIRPLEETLVQSAVEVLQQAYGGVGVIVEEEVTLCAQNRPWPQGNAILQRLHQGNFTSMSGVVTFGNSGVRKGTAIAMKSWHSYDSEEEPSSDSRSVRSLTGGGVMPTLRITAILSEPYVMLRELQADETAAGNDRYEGFCVDLIAVIAEEAGFNYEIQQVEDGTHGSYDANTGEWNGMIGELVHQRVDAAIGDISVTRARDDVVDFTDSWRSFGIGLLYIRSSRDSGSDWFEFLRPFSTDVWVYLIVACFLTAVLLFVLSRMSPSERNPPPKEDWTQFSLFNSLWWALATLARQFVVQQPRAASTRVLSLMWWLTVLVLLSAYIANWTSIRIAEVNRSSRLPIESIYDLPMQRDITYAAYYGGSTWAFFKNSKSETLQRVFSGLQNQALTGPISTNKMGLTRVRTGDGSFAFLMEEPTIEYAVERQCDLMQVGASVGSSSYAIALRTGSEYMDAFNDALFSLREAGTLETLRRKWWQQQRGGGQCVHEEVSTDEFPVEMSMENLAGVFLLLAGGGGVALVLALGECCWRSAALAREKDETFFGEMALQAQEMVSAPFDKEELGV